MCFRDRAPARRGHWLSHAWTPDIHSDAFETEAHRQSLALAAADRSGDVQQFVDAISIDCDE